MSKIKTLKMADYINKSNLIDSFNEHDKKEIKNILNVIKSRKEIVNGKYISDFLTEDEANTISNILMANVDDFFIFDELDDFELI